MARGFSSERGSAYGLVAPAVIALAAMTLYPLLAALALSFQRNILVFHEQRGVGLANYGALLGDGRFWSALANTVYFCAVAVAAEVLLGLAIALVLNAPFPGRGALRAAVLVPWAIPTVVAARMWAWFFTPDIGLASKLPPLRGVNWLGTPGYAMHAAILVDVWKTTPFVTLLLLAGLQSIPPDLYGAARVDGATGWQMFRRLTLPLLRPALLIAVLFRALDALRVFDAIYVLTEGGPANTTETLSIYAYKTLMRSGDFGYGATLSMGTFLFILLFSLGYLGLFGRRLEGGP